MSPHENPFKVRSASTFGADFKITEAITKLEQSTSNLVTSMTKLGDLARMMATSHHGGMSFFHAMMFGPHIRRDITGFWNDFYRAGRRIGFNSSPLSPTNARPLGQLADSITERSRHAFMSSATLANNALRAASPLTSATLEKSWTLWQAKAAGSLVKPTSRLIMRLQDGANWFDRQGEGTKDAIGWGVAGTVAAAGATFALGTFTRAVRDCASAARFAAGIFDGMRAARNVQPLLTGPGASAAGAGGGAAVARGGATVAGGAGRVAAGTGKLAKWGIATALATAAFDAVDNIQGAFGPNKKYSANNYTFGLPVFLDALINPLANARQSKIGNEDDPSGYGGRLRKEFFRNNMGAMTALPQQGMIGRQFTSITGLQSDWLDWAERNSGNHASVAFGQKLNKWFSDIEEGLGLSRSFGSKGEGGGGLLAGIAGDKAKIGGPYDAELPSRVQPAFLSLEDVYRQVALAGLESPLDQKIRKAQDANDQAMLKELQTANGHLEKISGMPPALPTR